MDKDIYGRGSQYTYPAQKVDLNALPDGLELLDENGNSALVGVSAPKPNTVVLYDPKCGPAYLPDMNPGLWLQFGRKWNIKIDTIEDMLVDIRGAIYSIERDRAFKLDLGARRVIDTIIGNNLVPIPLSDAQLGKGIYNIYLSTDPESLPLNEVFRGNDRKAVGFVASFWDKKEIKISQILNLLRVFRDHSSPFMLSRKAK